MGAAREAATWTGRPKAERIGMSESNLWSYGFEGTKGQESSVVFELVTSAF
jgi:hypothetical protein